MRRMPLGAHCKARLVASSRNPFNYTYRHAGLTLPGSDEWQLSMREMKNSRCTYRGNVRAGI
jgi:hypothetical protein